MNTALDTVLISLGEILTIISHNFWQLLIIIALMRIKKAKILTVILIFSHTLYGYQWWLYAIIIMIATLFCRNENEKDYFNYMP